MSDDDDDGDDLGHDIVHDHPWCSTSQSRPRGWLFQSCSAADFVAMVVGGGGGDSIGLPLPRRKISPSVSQHIEAS